MRSRSIPTVTLLLVHGILRLRQIGRKATDLSALRMTNIK